VPPIKHIGDSAAIGKGESSESVSIGTSWLEPLVPGTSSRAGSLKGNLMKNPAEMTDAEIEAALAERDKADKVSLPGRNVGSGAQRKRSANLPIKTLAERDKADKAAKALLRWPECGERRISKNDRRSRIVEP
jgi:hypothetical protein